MNIDADHISRTVLLTMHDGSQPTAEAADEALAATHLVLRINAETCRSYCGQAALLTAVVTGVRAFGTVHVVVDAPEAVVVSGPRQGMSLADAITGEGGVLVTSEQAYALSSSWPTLTIGTTPMPSADTIRSTVSTLRASWANWSATVESVASGEATLDNDCVLAAIAAGALGVSEAFSSIHPRAGSDAGYRTVRLNLWNPADVSELGPRLRFAPAAWWLVGLGHLGQANAWVISWLNYVDPSVVQVVLQDTDKLVPGNHSTGMLTPKDCSNVRKTRLVAQALDGIGFDTRIIERRLDDQTTLIDADTHVALIGVDNLPTRRLISHVGWTLTIDTGLGSGANDYSAILLRRFPGGEDSASITAWQDSDGEIVVPETPAFRELSSRGDECGAVEIAGTAVGVCFVGAVSACLSVAEAVRELHGGGGFNVVALDLTTMAPKLASATVQADVIERPLT